jgi:hypothetical protein
MKNIIIKSIILGIFLILVCTTPVSGFDTPTEVSDNASSVVIWYGDNFTIASANMTVTANITIQGLETAIKEAMMAATSEFIQGLVSIIAQYLPLLFAILITYFAYAFHDRFLSLLSGLALLFLAYITWQEYGLGYWSFVHVVFAGITFYKAGRDTKYWRYFNEK